VTDSASAIQPLLMGAPERAMAVADALFAQGFFVPAIRPPTVPEGTSQLRVSLSAAHTPDDVRGLAASIARALRA
jgi:8-amino-7-oxononanoate synthase